MASILFFFLSSEYEKQWFLYFTRRQKKYRHVGNRDKYLVPSFFRCDSQVRTMQERSDPSYDSPIRTQPLFKKGLQKPFLPDDFQLEKHRSTAVSVGRMNTVVDRDGVFC